MIDAGQVQQVTAKSMVAGGSGTSIVSGFALNEIGVVVGVIVGVAGLILNVWFGIRRDQRERELHLKLMSDSAISE